MNNEVMGGVVISLVSERPDKLLRRSGHAASSLSAQFVTLRGKLLLVFFFYGGTADPDHPASYPPKMCTDNAQLGGRDDRWMDDWMEEKRGEVMGRKNSKVKLVRGEERTRGKLVEDLSTTGSLHTGGDRLPGYSGERLQSKINPGEDDREEEGEDEDGTQVRRKMRGKKQPINN